MGKKVFLTILFCILTSLASARDKVFNATIDRIVDGDTVWVKHAGQKTKLRLLGIDTPEKNYSRKMYRDCRSCNVKQKQMQYLGRLASRHARLYLKKGQKVKVEIYGRGFYGRKLAIIYLPGGQDFNALMVRDGYACVYKYRGHKSRELPEDEWEKLNLLLERAKTERRGLWKEFYDIMDCLCN